MIVVDASAMVEVLLQTPAARTVATRLFRPTEELHAPHLIDVEILQALRRYAAMKQASPGRLQQAVDDWIAFPIHRHAHFPSAKRVWELRLNVSAYDSTYVALAEFLRAPLVTRDSRLANAPGHSAIVELI